METMPAEAFPNRRGAGNGQPAGTARYGENKSFVAAHRACPQVRDSQAPVLSAQGGNSRQNLRRFLCMKQIRSWLCQERICLLSERHPEWGAALLCSCGSDLLCRICQAAAGPDSGRNSALPRPRTRRRIGLKTGSASSTPKTLPLPKALAIFRPSGIPITILSTIST